MKIVIIDYGLGNPLSIKNMLGKLGAETIISSNHDELSKADKLILPGVGNFAKGMQNLKINNLQDKLNELVLDKKVPILGICLGMQLMTLQSEEGDLPGLAWIEANTIKFQFEDNAMKIPHMGWTDTHFVNDSISEDSFDEIPPRFYFVHSYYVKCQHESEILCESEYGHKFTSGFIKNNVMGVQFHPEKSHVFGKEFLNQFMKWKP